jgi:hypothetical protein
MTRRTLIWLALTLASTGFVLAGCGGSSSSSPSQSSTPGAPATAAAAAPPTAPTQGAAPAPLTAEAQSAAAGDIPDNQVFLTFRNTAAGYSMRYPEGWAQQGSDARVTFQDKNNLVRVTISSGAPLGLAAVRADMARAKGAAPSLRAGPPQAVTISGSPAIKVVYSTESKANPVTSKRVTLVVDRYYLAHGGKRAVVDLGGPKGVDNADAYRLMIESFLWK